MTHLAPYRPFSHRHVHCTNVRTLEFPQLSVFHAYQNSQMISNHYSDASNTHDASVQRPNLQEFRDLRKPFIVRARQTGFTLIELMIVLGVITIVAVIAFVGIRNNQWEGA